MALSHRPTERVLFLAFLAIAVTFLTGIALGQRYVWQIRTATDAVTRNATAGIQLLSSMRSAVRSLELFANEQVATCGAGSCAPPRPRLASLRHALREDWESYGRLPVFPGEENRRASVDEDLARLTGSLEQLAALTEAGKGREAEQVLRYGVKPSCDRLDASIPLLSEYGAIQGQMAETRIHWLARTAMAISVVLGLLGAALAAVTASFAIRFVRRSEQLLRARAEELDRFAGQMAHDVLSPLSGLAMSVQLAVRDASPQSREALERGLRSLVRSRDLVHALLSFARAEAAPTEGATADVPAVLTGVVEELHDLAAERRVQVSVEPSVAVQVACSAGVLMSVLGNIVRNAVKYMGDGARREVRVRVAATDGSAVRFEVEDTGPGIPKSLGERVFEPFVRGASDPSGSGLGLATAKRLVTAHGGRIGFRSQDGQGTLFWVELPQARGEAAAGSPAPSAG
jgi:signal transduction histidine kinase